MMESLKNRQKVKAAERGELNPGCKIVPGKSFDLDTLGSSWLPLKATEMIAETIDLRIVLFQPAGSWSSHA
jgi:hypothetical protein